MVASLECGTAQRRASYGSSNVEFAELSGKLVDLAKELNKSQSSVSYLWHTDWPDGQHRYTLTREAAEKVIRASPITNIAQLNDVLITIKQRGSTAFIVQPSPFRGPIPPIVNPCCDDVRIWAWRHTET